MQLDARMICIALDSVRFDNSRWATEALGVILPPRPGAAFVAASEDNAAGCDGYSPGEPLPILSLFDPRLIEVETLSHRMPACPAAALRIVYKHAGSTADKSEAGKVAAKVAALVSHRDSETAQRMLACTGTQPAPGGFTRINDFFERVLIINLDRRADRWNRVAEQLARAAVAAARVPAIDAVEAEILAEYGAYSAGPLVQIGADGRKIHSSREYYFEYQSQRARVAWVEERTQKKAIASAGAWAYQRTWEQILEQALRDHVDTLLVFDDDVVFHKKAQSVFSEAIAELPSDWLILQLGTLQYHWERDWVVPAGEFLYCTNGYAVGSHAVGLKLEVMPFLLDQVKRMELPFDTGALAAATRAFVEQCFVITPNVAIQRLDDRDINASDFQKSRTREEAMEIYRWVERDYAF